MTAFTDSFAFESGGIGHRVFHAGEGPLVLLLHEATGTEETFWRLARLIEAAGFTVWAPDLWGGPGDRRPRFLGAMGTIRMCVSREIHAFAANRSSPVVDYLRALLGKAEGEGHRRAGVVGLCMTGNFALSLVTETATVAAVASEPALPLGFGKRSALHLSPREERALAEREGVPVLALRFKGDPLCTAGKFAALRSVVGERLETIEIDSRHKNPEGNPFPHSVLTKDLIDKKGEPTREAADRVIALLSSALRSGQTAR